MIRNAFHILVLLCLGLVASGGELVQADGIIPAADKALAEPAAPDRALAQQLFSLKTRPSLQYEGANVPGWTVSDDDGVVGYIASTWEISRSVGYSGRPLDVLVAIDPQARIIAAKLMRHSEPILTLGLSDDDIARFVSGFAGIDLKTPDAETSPEMPQIISRATVSTGVIRDSILRTARTLAIARGALAGGSLDRVSFASRDWSALLGEGALTTTRVSLSEAHENLSGAKVPVPEGDGAFIELYAAVIDPPTIGRNLLGQLAYTRAVGGLGPNEFAFFVASRGLYSHRGVNWRRSGVFDRITLVQGEQPVAVIKPGYTRVDELAIAGAPSLKERSIFAIPVDAIDPAQPFTLELLVTRASTDGGEVSFVVDLPYALPSDYIEEPPDGPAPLWQTRWQEKRLDVISVMAMLFVLTLILFFQETFVRRPKLWRGVRYSFLTVTFLWLGMVLNGQLSVVQVVAFIHALLSGFRWETFLIEPVIFTLWGFVALGLLFWGRGVFCGWLCPFGALQELLNGVARAMKIPQVAVPNALHERLWIIKYTLFVAILALSFYSMKQSLILSEIEPFKTAISLRMIRAWPFVLSVLLILVAGLFIERFYCRYLCPLGAGLAIPAKLKVFDWLHRRPQCGRECRLCETKCTVGAIDPIGRINPNECVLCLRCQVVMNDQTTCPVLKRRARKAS